MGLYAQQCEKYGYQVQPQQLGWATPIYVSDTDESAMREARPHIEAFYNKFLRMPIEMLLPPGYLSLASLAAVGDKARAAAPQRPKAQTIENRDRAGHDHLRQPRHACAQQLEHHQKEVGYGKVIAMMQFGTLPHDMTKRSMELFATQGDAEAASHRRGRVETGGAGGGVKRLEFWSGRRVRLPE